MNLFKTCVFVVFFLIFQSAAASNTQVIDAIVAVVNKHVITKTELDNRINMTKHMLGSQGTALPPDNILRQKVLQQMINQDLQLQMAEQTGIHVTDEELTQMILQVAKQNNKTVEQLRDSVIQSGQSYEDFRQELHKELIIHHLQQRDVGSRIIVTEQEVRDFSRSFKETASDKTEYHLANILIALPEAPSKEQITQAKALATSVLNDIHQGKDFERQAIEHSGDQRALKGGHLGWRTLAQLPTVFVGPVTHMKKNDVVGPIQTSNGFHLIKLIDIRNKKSEKNTGEKHIKEAIFQRKYEENLQKWIARLRASAYVKIINE